MLKNKCKTIMFGMLSAALLMAVSGVVSFAGNSGYAYSGTVSKISDFETKNLKKKADKSSKATNKVEKKPSGSFACWIETSSGDNCTYKTSL